MPSCKGFTLVEFMVAVTILAILSAITIPNFNKFITQMRVDNEISALFQLLLIARNTAINSGTEVTVCPLDEGNRCSTLWQNEISVFIDSNDNKVYDRDSDDRLIKVKNAVNNSDKLQYALGRYRIVYAPTGRTVKWGSNGTLKYCPKNQENESRGIIISTSGRLYASSDKDNDGKDEDRNGKEITCR
ncbi:GspH/FimT family pseudopilin [Colwelliaceae bacterium 6471]